MLHHPDLSNKLAKMHVITMISNPVRYRSRVELYHNFKRHIESLGAQLWTCEIAYGDRPHMVTTAGDPRALQLRTTDEVWHKENCLNLMIQRLPTDWEYVCWVDADISFARHDVLLETWHKLQHHPVVQMWSNANDLDPNGRSMKVAKSFAACYLDGGCRDPSRSDPYSYAHTGYAYGARRDAIQAFGGLLDCAPLGSADFYMAWGLIGELNGHLNWRLKQGFTPGYVEAIRAWQTNAAVLKKDIGVVEGLLTHHWHGRKIDRGYNSREKILVDNKFDPVLDLKRDWQGLLALTDRNPRLRFDIRAYLRARNEDSSDLE